jgi:hypothetical protein
MTPVFGRSVAIAMTATLLTATVAFGADQAAIGKTRIRIEAVKLVHHPDAPGWNTKLLLYTRGLHASEHPLLFVEDLSPGIVNITVPKQIRDPRPGIGVWRLTPGDDNRPFFKALRHALGRRGSALVEASAIQGRFATGVLRFRIHAYNRRVLPQATVASPRHG